MRATAMTTTTMQMATTTPVLRPPSPFPVRSTLKFWDWASPVIPAEFVANTWMQQERAAVSPQVRFPAALMLGP